MTRKRGAVIIPFLLALLLASAQAGGFDARRDLEGFAACEASEFAPLYGFEPFLAAGEKALAPAELAALRTRWNDERARVAAEIERIGTVAAERALWEVRKRIPRDSPLARARFRRFDAFAPFHLFLEQAEPEDEGYYGAFVDTHGPWLVELERGWSSEFAVPLELERGARARALPVYVLRSEEAYARHFAARPSLAPYAARARFDAELGALVTFTSTKANDNKALLRRALLHGAAQLLVSAWSKDGRPPAALWLDLGLAEYLSAHRGLLPAALGARTVDLDALKNLAAAQRAPGGLDVFLVPIPEFVALADLPAAVAHCRARAGGAPARVNDGFESTPWYVQAQASALVWYLYRGEDSKHRALLLEVVDRALRGEAGAAQFQSAFGRDLAPLERSFRQWLQPTIWNETGFNLPVALEPFAVVSSAAKPATREVDLRALRVDAHDPEALLARALLEARKGAFAGAAQRLRAALPTLAEPMRARCAREVERLESFVACRRAFFTALAAPGARKFEWGEGAQRLLAQVVGVDERVARLGDNKRGQGELVLEELDPLALVEAMRDKKYAFDAGADAGYVYVLFQDARWRKALAGDAPARVALRADAEADYPGHFTLARALELLEGLADAGVPAEAGAAATTLAHLRELLGAHATRAQVVERRAALTDLAHVALEQRFVADGLAGELSGRVEILPEGRVRITYPFETPQELADWEQTGYMEAGAFGRTRVDFTVDGGRLVTTGWASMRHKLPLEGRQYLHCRLRYGEPVGTHDPRFFFLLALNDDGQHSYAGSDGGGVVYVRDHGADFMRESAPTDGIVIGEPYRLDVGFDGENLESRLNGTFLRSVPVGPRRQGHVLVFSSADYPLAIEELSLEGTPAPAALGPLRARWVAEQLRELGF